METAKHGIAVREVRGAVERIDVPAKRRIRLLAAAFLCHDGVLGEMRPQAGDDGRLGFLVRLGHQIHVALVTDLPRTVELRQKDRTRLLGGFDGEFEIVVRAQWRSISRVPRHTIMPEIARDLLGSRT